MLLDWRASGCPAKRLFGRRLAGVEFGVAETRMPDTGRAHRTSVIPVVVLAVASRVPVVFSLGASIPWEMTFPNGWRNRKSRTPLQRQTLPEIRQWSQEKLWKHGLKRSMRPM